MNIKNRLIKRMISENISYPCKMFWCIPKPVDDSDNIVWDTVMYDSDGDDLSNWIIVLHELKRAWGLDFDPCRENPDCLPRGILADNFLYHGNNLPHTVDLSDVAKSMGCDLGKDATPIYDKRYGVSQESLSKIQEIIGKELNVQYTD